MSTEGHNHAAVCLGAQSTPIAVCLAGLRWTCEKTGSVLIGPVLPIVISRNNHNRREPALMHHACTFLCITRQVYGKARLILPINHREIVFGLPVVCVGKGNNLVILKNAAHQINHVPQNLASGWQVWEISRSVEPQ